MAKRQRLRASTAKRQGGLQTGGFSRSRFLRVGLIVGLIAWFGLNLWTLERYPPVTCDETIYMRTAERYERALSGGESWPQGTGVVFWLPHGRAYWLALNGAFALLGETLYAARLVSLVGWGGAVAATYVLGRQAVSRRAGLWSAGLVGLAWVALHTGHRARPDMLAAAVGTVTFGLVILARQRDKGWLYLVLGLAATLQLDFHFNLVHFTWPIALLITICLVRERAFGKLGWFVLGLVVGGLFVVWLHLGGASGPILGEMFGNPVGFIAGYVARGQEGGRDIGAALLNGFASFGRFWWRYYGRLAPVLSILQAVLFIGGLVFALLVRDRSLRTLLLLVVLSSLTFAVVNAGYQLIGYAMLWLPLYTVLGVAAVYGLAERLRGAPEGKRRATNALLGVMALLYLAGDAYLIATHPAGLYRDAAARLLEDIEPGSRVLTGSLWWHAMRDEVVFIDENLLWPTRSSVWLTAVPDEDPPEMSLVSSIVRPHEARPLVKARLEDELQPDYVIDDGVTGCQSTISPVSRVLTLYLEEHCTRLDEVTLKLYGSQTIYACEWPDR
jgi:4-amino-4-deoxy-L-arabinose transferase-like glycosyltransferase